jgi:hypothetical protein
MSRITPFKLTRNLAPHLGGVPPPKNKPTAAKLRNRRVAIMRARGHHLGTVSAPDQKSAETEWVRAFGPSKDQRKRLLILKRG